jgi:hypothetical protein
MTTVSRPVYPGIGRPSGTRRPVFSAISPSNIIGGRPNRNHRGEYNLFPCKTLYCCSFSFRSQVARLYVTIVSRLSDEISSSVWKLALLKSYNSYKRLRNYPWSTHFALSSLSLLSLHQSFPGKWFHQCLLLPCSCLYRLCPTTQNQHTARTVASRRARLLLAFSSKVVHEV